MEVPPRPEQLTYARQMGITDLVMANAGSLTDDNGTWQVKDLAMMRLNVESHGLRVAAMENVPISFYDHIMLGGPKRDQQIDNMITTIRNMALAGIPVFGYHWMPSSVWRTTPKPVRGGAIATAFNYDEVKDLPFTHEREYTE